jgi:hypothetical protein
MSIILVADSVYVIISRCANIRNLDACEVTLSVYPHRASLKNMPDHGGNRTYDLWNTRHIFQACPVWIYTQSITSQASYSPEYITPTQQIS